jgi:hypothetical protein
MNSPMLLLLLSLLAFAAAQVIDLRSQKQVENTWFEVGSSLISPESPVTINSQYQNYVQPVIFVRYSKETFLLHPLNFVSTLLSFQGMDFPHPLQIRASNIQSNAGAISFQLQLLSTNDSYCSKQWWIPNQYPNYLNVSWLIIEEGGYSINGSQVVIGSAEVSAYVTKVDWEHSFGRTCHYPAAQGDDDFAPGGIFSLQTMNNGQTYLLARTTQWWYKEESNKCSYSWQSGRFFLESHDGYPADDKFLLKNEILSYLLFDSTPHIIDCLSGSRMEFGLIHGVTNQPFQLSLRHAIDSNSDFVSLYGSVNGYQGGDSIVIRSYYEPTDSLSPYIYLQVGAPSSFPFKFLRRTNAQTKK